MLKYLCPTLSFNTSDVLEQLFLPVSFTAINSVAPEIQNYHFFMTRNNYDFLDFIASNKGWFPLGVDCRRSAKDSLFILFSFTRGNELAPSQYRKNYLRRKSFTQNALAARIKLNKETKNFSRYA